MMNSNHRPKDYEPSTRKILPISKSLFLTDKGNKMIFYNTQKIALLHICNRFESQNLI